MELAPHGDFANLVTKYRLARNTKLVRTFFRHLVDGVSYLHSKGFAHLDLKLGNLLLGEEFKLKICDFEFTCMRGDTKQNCLGTKNFRAPEIRDNESNVNAFKADIYSMGIILFAMLTGRLPYDETKPMKGYQLYSILRSESEKFWEVHDTIKTENSKLSKDFKTLFM
mmetsp:Transcript_4895/g.4087  ORF Transcript_4895/g.4087 Transcript_4895/m.4087 type:complete len:168 (-) Transcript_4895:869-1372(-)